MNNLWSDIDMFQLLMLIFYIIILVPMWSLMYPVFTLYHSRWYINPDVNPDSEYLKEIDTMAQANAFLNDNYY